MPEQSAAVPVIQTAPAKYEFFVYIIESPSAPDLYHGRSEGHCDIKRWYLVPNIPICDIQSESRFADPGPGCDEIQLAGLQSVT